MQVGQFPAAAADSLIEGYCDDFVALAAILAQTLEQVSIRGIECRRSRPALERIERGMRDLADAIHDLLQRGAIAQGLTDRLKPGGTTGLGPLDVLGGPGAPTLLPPEPPPASPSTRPGARDAQPAARFTAMSTEPWFSVPKPTGLTGGGPAGGGAAGGIEQLRVADIGHEPPRRPAPWLGDAERQSKPGAAPAKGAPGLRGTAASLPVLSVFQFLGRMRKTGVMRIEMRDETLTFEFAKGCVQGCASTARLPNERLGAILYELGACTHDQMVGLVAQFDDHSCEQIGAKAVREGIASNGQVLEALELQVRRRFKRACAAPEARYEFSEGQAASTDGRMQIAPTELTFEPDARSGG